MGTNCKVTIDPGEIDFRILLYEVKRVSHSRWDTTYNNLIISDWDEGSWVSSKEDMLEITRLFPDNLFTVEYLDEFGDRWKEFYLNNKYYTVYPEIVYPEFDPSILNSK